MGLDVQVADGPALAITADPALLRRALWNLVENAAKYGAAPITLSAARAGDRVLLAVTDHGVGIAPADREKVFAPFYRGSSAASAPSDLDARGDRNARRSDATQGDGDARRGVGLGLTLARQVAQVHGGTITIEAVDEHDRAPRGCRVVLSIASGVTA
jgi:signal transduction histidine kinase